MKRVIIESPYAATKTRSVEDNIVYAREAMRYSLQRQEAPFASHLLYTQALDDALDSERALGIRAGFIWGMVADLVAVYCDFGLSRGMKQGIGQAQLVGKPIVYRFKPPGDILFAESLMLPDMFNFDASTR